MEEVRYRHIEAETRHTDMMLKDIAARVTVLEADQAVSRESLFELEDRINDYITTSVNNNMLLKQEIELLAERVKVQHQ